MLFRSNTVGELENGKPAEAAIIPVDAFNAAFPPPNEHCEPDEDYEPIYSNKYSLSASVAVGETETILAVQDNEIRAVLFAKNIEGRFPDYKSVLPTKTPLASIMIDASILRDLLAVAESLESHDHGGGTWIDIHEKLLGLRVENEGQSLLGILVGLVEL